MIIDLNTIVQSLRKRRIQNDKFNNRSRKAAEAHDYQVSFSGVGTPQNALANSSEILTQFRHFQDVGFCTQIAIFTRHTSRTITDSTPLWGNLEVLLELHYPVNMLTDYPPDSITIATAVGDMWRQLRPEYQAGSSPWQYTPSAMSKVLGGKYYEGDKVLVCRVPLEELYGMNYNLQKLFHFNTDVFVQVSQDLVGQEYDRGTVRRVVLANIEFIGLELGSVSLRGFRFVFVQNRIHVLYEFSRNVN
jgi:hypothetical protein